MSPFDALDAQLRTALKQAGVSLAIGGFDISMNEHETGSFPPHWKPHAWLVVRDSELLLGYQRLRAHFPKAKDTVPNPVKAYHWDGNLSAIAYALKGEFHRRITLASTKDWDGQKKRRNVRYRDLRAKQKVELLIALNRTGLHRRLFLHGADLIEKKGGVRIKKT